MTNEGLSGSLGGGAPAAPGRGVGRFRSEVSAVMRLSLPVIGAQVGAMLTGFVDILMVARLGVLPLAASAVGNLLYWVAVSIGLGAVSGVDPLVSQAHGANQPLETGKALQSALGVAALVSAPIMLILSQTEPLLLATGQQPEVAKLAATYNLWRLAGVPAFLAFSALRIYLQGRGHLSPATWVIWLANGLNVLLNWALIWGHLGLPALGFVGAAQASLLTTCSLPLLLLAWMWRRRLWRGAWPGWEGTAFRISALAKVLRLGVPIGIQMGLEVGAFGFATAMAGHLGVLALGAHQVVVQVSALMFMVPTGISMAASIRVGNLIGARQLPAMRRALRASLTLGALVGAVSATGFLTLREYIPHLFGVPESLAALATSCLPVVAAFQVVDGIQVVAAGVLRGMGRAVASAWVNLLGWGAVGLPAAYYLSTPAGLGLVGLWMGLALGLAFAAICLGTWALLAKPLNVQR